MADGIAGLPHDASANGLPRPNGRNGPKTVDIDPIGIFMKRFPRLALFFGLCLPLPLLANAADETLADVAGYRFVAREARPGKSTRQLLVIHGDKTVWAGNPNSLETSLSLQSTKADVDGDGQPDIHITGYTGGAYCCTKHYVFATTPRFRLIADYDQGNGDALEFIQVKGRRKAVLLGIDRAFSEGRSIQADAPIILEAADGDMRLASDLMRADDLADRVAEEVLENNDHSFLSTARERKESQRALEAEMRALKQKLRPITATDVRAQLLDGISLSIISQINSWVFRGSAHSAWPWIDRFWPGNVVEKARFLEEYRRQLESSSFHGELLRMNGGHW